jgi:hypothetical protein
MEPVPDQTSIVVRCPTCGYRTDEPGAGVLGDGFDILHRQFGGRGDYHAWHALREVLAHVPTPPADAEIRQTVVDALDEITMIDIDTTTELRVHRPHLDHGGMGGGMVDVGYWRNKGIPLLVQRASDRRPPPREPDTMSSSPDAAGEARRPRRIWSWVGGVVLWAVLVAMPAALLGGGTWLLYQRAVGTRVDATVLGCETSGNFRKFGSTIRTECYAEWTIDGETVVGNFSAGNGQGDVGRTVSATVRGDTAYSRSLGLPILLLALGLPLALFLGWSVKLRLSGRSRPRSVDQVASGASPVE